MVIPGAAVIPSAQPRRPARLRRPERGAALVEFALVSLVLYLLLAGAIEFGRLMFDANALQDVARVAARELAVAPVRAEATFDYALSCDAASDPGCLVDLRARIFDPACLVVDLNDPAVAFDPDGYFAAMPVVNRALRSLMISEPSRPGVLRYAGALLERLGRRGVQRDRARRPGRADGADGGHPARRVARRRRRRGDQVGAGRRGNSRGPGRGLSVERTVQPGVPRQRGRRAGRSTPIRWQTAGLAAVRINYPYQAATLSGFRSSAPNGIDPMPPNVGSFIAADDGGVQELNVAPGGLLDDGAVGPYPGRTVSAGSSRWPAEHFVRIAN